MTVIVEILAQARGDGQHGRSRAVSYLPRKRGQQKAKNNNPGSGLRTTKLQHLPRPAGGKVFFWHRGWKQRPNIWTRLGISVSFSQHGWLVLFSLQQQVSTLPELSTAREAGSPESHFLESSRHQSFLHYRNESYSSKARKTKDLTVFMMSMQTRCQRLTGPRKR